MVAGADGLVDFSTIPNYVKLQVNSQSSVMGRQTKEHENSQEATYVDSLTAIKVWLCNVSKWAFSQHPDTITYDIVD